MKIPDHHSRKRRQRDGIVAFVVMLAVLAIILVFVSIGIRSLSTLEREVKLVEQQQIQRLESRTLTNSAALPPTASQK